jgi:isopentenyl-diphosphate delta-isomerase type 1
MNFRPANAEELFDVVDLMDQVVGQAPRKEVHARNLVHRATHVMIHDFDGRLFFQKRSMSKDTFPGCWDSSCSGHVDSGEDYVTAARRELGEELGWHDTSLPLRPLTKLTPSPDNGYEFIQIFIMGPLWWPFTLHPEEISEGRWMFPDEVDVLIKDTPHQVAGALRMLWSQYRAKILAAIGG